jgi:peptide-methionine (S)-S-oxide reductase
MHSEKKIETATIGNGCFWCTEAVFKQLNGVLDVKSGYSGGHMDNPDYKTVCAGTTGHAECLQIEFDANVVSFHEILEVFWKTHDPTTLNRQGGDVGTQYRSIIFFHDAAQAEIATAYKFQLDQSGVYPNPIVTLIEPYDKFYAAEDYHQNYFALNGSNPYCQMVVRPKVEKFQKVFSEKLKK